MPEMTLDAALSQTPDLLRMGLAGDGFLRWAAVDLTATVEAARQRHDLSPVAAVALGQALSATTLLLRFSMKTPSTLMLELIGDGPLGKVTAEAESDGRLRGRVDQPQTASPDEGLAAIGTAVGRGILRVTRQHGKGRHTSHVALETGSLSLDLAHYLEQSEQIHSAVMLGVLPRPAGVGAAGGLIVEALPGAEDEHLKQLESNLATLGSVAGLLARGGVGELVRGALAGFDREVHSEQPQVWSCRCRRQALLEKLIGLAADDFESLFAESPGCLAVCAFCNQQYDFDRDELVAARAATEPADA